jgi:hypothetical protein
VEGYAVSLEATDVSYGPYEPGDEHEILRVFNKVFGQQRQLPTWEWEFNKNPAGRHIFLAKQPSGRVLSQFCGIPRVMRAGGGSACFGEIVDSMTDPEFRMGLKRPGLFATTCYEFVEYFGRPDREVIMYGLPNPQAFRLGGKLLGYSHLYDVQFMTTTALNAPLPAACQRIEALPPDWNAFEERVAARHGVTTLRDQRYMNWRYLENPDVRYELLAFRDECGVLFALAVLRHGWLGLKVSACAELMVDHEHPQAMQVNEGVRAAAAASGSERVQVFVRPESMEWVALGSIGWWPEPSQFRFVARTYDDVNLPLEGLKHAWSVSLGDFDIV